MKTVIVLVIDHPKPIPNLAQLVAARAWTIDGVEFVSEPIAATTPTDPQETPSAPNS
jgi:hypothetical protein